MVNVSRRHLDKRAAKLAAESGSLNSDDLLSCAVAVSASRIAEHNARADMVRQREGSSLAAAIVLPSGVPTQLAALQRIDAVEPDPRSVDADCVGPDDRGVALQIGGQGWQGGEQKDYGDRANHRSTIQPVVAGTHAALGGVRIMIGRIFGWLTGRVESALRANQAKIAVGQCAAHAMVLYLYGLPITVINASGKPYNGAMDKCLLRMPGSVEDTVRFVQCTTLASAAEHISPTVAQELLSGSTLKGLCDENGRLLGAGDDIIGRADASMQKIVADEDIPLDRRIFFVDVVAKRVVAHYYLAIVNLAAALLKQPLVIGEQACRDLVQECLRRGPVNSVKIECVDSDKERLLLERWRHNSEQLSQNRP